MKTYTREIQEPRLKILYDDNAESPRSDTNLGFFITQDKRMYSPDDHADFMEVIKETGDVAKNEEEYIKLIKETIESRFNDEKVLAVYPVVKYEHGGVSYRLGSV